MSVAVFLILALAGPGVGDAPWYSHYDRGLALIEEGNAAEARAHLVAALEQRAEPGRLVRTYGLRYVDYLPHLYLAVANHMLGDFDAARSHLLAAERWGVAVQTEAGNTLLPAYQLLLSTQDEAAGFVEPPPVERPPGARAESTTPAETSYREYEPKDVVLSDTAYRELHTEVSHRCGIRPDVQASRLPWYFHYEMGVALSRRGDPQRALDALVVAADRRPVSQHGARMYGMWFTDYLPYYAIAQAHAELGNWECVLDALEVSAEMGEVDEADDEYAAFRALMEEARSP